MGKHPPEQEEQAEPNTRLSGTPQEMERRFQATFEQAAVGMAHVAPDGHFLTINQKFCSIVGYTHTELLQHTFQEITYPDDLSVDIAFVEQLLAGERTTYTMEKRYIHQNGSLIWINLTVSLVCADDGTPQYFISVIEDISQRKCLEKNLQQQNELLQRIINNAPDIIARFDHELRHLSVNHTATRVTGLAAADFIGKTNREMGMPDAQVEIWDKALQAVFATGEVGTIEFSFPTPDGVHWYQSKLTPERDQSGNIVAVQAVARDVTDLRQTQEKLKRSEARSQRLSDANIIGIVFAEGTRIIEANDAFLQIVGYQQADVQAQRIDWATMTPPEYASLDEHTLQQLQSRGSCAPFEKEYIRKDGSRIPILIGAAAVQQNPLQWICFVMDLSEQKRINDELVRAAHAFQMLADHVPDIITRHDTTTFRYLYANAAVTRATGLPPEAFPGKTSRKLGIPEEQCLFFEQQLTKVVEAGLPFTVEYNFPIDGRMRQYQSNLIPEYDGDQKMISILVITYDITELKEQELRKDAFISIAGHELRTPLTALKGNLQLADRQVNKLLSDRQEPSILQVRTELQTIQKRLARSLHQVGLQQRLINDLLDVSRITANKLTLSIEECDLKNLVHESVEDQRTNTPTRTITLEMQVTEPVIVRADQGRIEQVISNYLNNAIRYSNKDQLITVGLTVQDQQARIWVQDHGPGLSAEAQKHVWERFYQEPGVSIQTGSGVGLGLGLYICQTIIARHGGQIGVESVLKQGSTFWFTLPLAH
ncbi:histidine kinase [Dictyobacter vulcani]|uniref:histidine kinase n=1 Tax=Dictyobacter vulcani TaxID=2607529 RepID=A0A5J4KXC7_9CHLR|nr:PAS domain-containing sensor histidine kinase [Dictyobacter vulcani]GER91200.1 histidine kinase [Dictyobacter vulcani]